MNPDPLNQILARYPRFSFSLLPTPLHLLKEISRMTGNRIYCKRDDLTGFAFGGNKTRKLDYLMADAREQGADTIIAIGANQSNYCRMAAAAARTIGMEAHLVLGGKTPDRLTGNLLLDDLFGARRHHIDTKDDDLIGKESAALEQKLTAAGKKVYRMPMGGSTPVGTLGYVQAFGEIMEDAQRLNVMFDTIILATGSAGTQAGLVVGKALTGWHGRIIGMSVSRDAEAAKEKVYRLAEKTASMFKATVQESDVLIEDSYRGPEYGARTQEGEEAIRLFAEKEGILLDYVYTGKAAAGLLDLAQKNYFDQKENILFIHTGGNIELFE